MDSGINIYESNPEVINAFLSNMGIPKEWSICDVFAFDKEILDMIPQPTLAIIFLFPKNQKVALEEVPECANEGYEDLYFMKQLKSNSCGTIALIHALANNRESIGIGPSGPIGYFLEKSKDMSPDEKGNELDRFMNVNSDAAATAAAADDDNDDADDDDVDDSTSEYETSGDEMSFHFITLIQKNGIIYELDGLKKEPVSHGTSSSKTFLVDACKVCKKFMDKDPKNINFTVLALTKSA